MVVKDIMKTDVATCRPGSPLAEVARLMRDRDCGFVPVVNSLSVVVGVVTDRDLGIALGASTRAAERISAAEVMSEPVVGCFADENVKAVLATMGNRQVRRLPVLEKQHGHLEGVISLDDVALAPQRRGSPAAEDIADAFRRIVTPRHVEAVTA